MSVPFGVVIPGRPLLTEFRAVDSQRLTFEVQNAREVTDLVFFLLPTSPVAPGMAALLYCSFGPPPYSGWELVGAVSQTKPSGVFRTGWPENEQIPPGGAVTLGISLEGEDVMHNLELDRSGVEERKTFALKIAQDLFNFMTSFSQTGPGQGSLLTVPASIFDRWMERFENKYKRDPNFMLK